MANKKGNIASKKDDTNNDFLYIFKTTQSPLRFFNADISQKHVIIFF